MRNFWVIVAIIATAGAGLYWWTAPSGAPDEAGRRGKDRPVAVVTAPAARKDVQVFLDGLGTVQAYRTVTVRTRVDGELIEVAYKEGQDIRAGDVLARIDPRTYQAQLDQATATRDKDAAQRDNAKRDLERYVSLGDRVAGQNVDGQRALVRQLEATVRADQAAVDNAQTMLSYTTIKAPIDGRTGLRGVDAGNIVHASDLSGLVVLTQLQPIAVIFTLPQQDLQAVLGAEKNEAGQIVAIAMQADGKTEIDRGSLELVDNQIDTATGTVKLKAVMPNAKRHLWPGGFVNIRLLVATRRNAVTAPPAAIQQGPQGPYVFVVQTGQKEGKAEKEGKEGKREGRKGGKTEGGEDGKADGKPRKTVEVRPVKVGVIEGDSALIEEGLKEGEIVVVEGGLKLKEGSRVVEAGDRAKEDGQGKPAAEKRDGGKDGAEKSDGSGKPAAEKPDGGKDGAEKSDGSGKPAAAAGGAEAAPAAGAQTSGQEGAWQGRRRRRETQ